MQNSPLAVLRAASHRPLAIAVAVAALCATAQGADAALIQNGGFETGNLSGWTSTGDVTISAVPVIGVGSIAADGSYYAIFNAGISAPNGVLSQSFTAVGGTQYSFSYVYGAGLGLFQSITAAVKDSNGNVIASQFSTAPLISNALSSYTLTFFAATSTNLTISFTDYASNLSLTSDGYLDNVSVTAVPEPSSLAVMAVGLLFGWGALRSRRRLDNSHPSYLKFGR